MWYINEDMMETISLLKKTPKKTKIKKQDKLNFFEPPWFIFVLGMLSFNFSLWLLPISIIEKGFIFSSAIIITFSALSIRKKINALRT